jgi:hypothetical protein
MSNSVTPITIEASVSLAAEQREEKTHLPHTDSASGRASSMPPHVFDALQLVLEHYYRQELDHYESGGPGEALRIFHALNHLKHWAANQ